jgi:hypothetical protein
METALLTGLCRQGIGKEDQLIIKNGLEQRIEMHF